MHDHVHTQHFSRLPLLVPQASLGKCLEGCADQYRKQVPKLISDMQAQIKQLP